MSYDDWQQLRPENPPWMRGRNTGALVGGLGKIKDVLVARLRAGVLARFPDATFAADDALGYKGSERQLPRATGESSSAYALRLREAWEAWSLAGGHGALLRQLELHEFFHAHIVQDNGLWSKLAKAPADFTARLATTADLSSWTFGGSGNTLTAPSNGAVTFDGVSPALNDVIFVRLRSSTPNSLGVYRYSQVGDSTHPGVLSRVSAWGSGDTIAQHTAISVTAGNTLAGYQFQTLETFVVNGGAPSFESGLVSGGIIFGDTNTYLALSRPAWSFDLRTDMWSRFLVLFTGPGLVSALLPLEGQQLLRSVVARWKPAYADYVGCLQITAGQTWGWPPDRKWGSWTWGGGATTFLDP